MAAASRTLVDGSASFTLCRVARSPMTRLRLSGWSGAHRSFRSALHPKGCRTQGWNQGQPVQICARRPWFTTCWAVIPASALQPNEETCHEIRNRMAAWRSPHPHNRLVRAEALLRAVATNPNSVKRSALTDLAVDAGGGEDGRRHASKRRGSARAGPVGRTSRRRHASSNTAPTGRLFAASRSASCSPSSSVG